MKRLTVSLLCLVMCFGAAVSAAAAPVAGITAAPAIQELQAQPGAGTVSFVTSLTNNTGTQVALAVSAQDFTALGQNGSIEFQDQDSSGTHGLAAHIVADNAVVVLAPGQSREVHIRIVDVDTLSPGGHYAAVVYKALGDASGGRATVSLLPAVSTLVFMTTASGGTQSLRLTTPFTPAIRTDVPRAVNLVLTNTGNVQTAARGYVQLLGPGGALHGQGVINVDSGLILPGAQRLFMVNLSSVEQRETLWPGTYKIKVYYRYDGEAKYQTYEQSFVLVNLVLVAGVLVLVVVALVFGLWMAGRTRRHLVKRTRQRS